MTSISSIPLNKLVAWPNNVRKTAGADDAFHELASSIAGARTAAVARRA
jgi:Tfp pilus assembly protein FimT